MHMQRLVLAIIVVVVLSVILLIAAAGLRTALARTEIDDRSDGMVQKVAFALLIALMGYVAVAGGD